MSSGFGTRNLFQKSKSLGGNLTQTSDSMGLIPEPSVNSLSIKQSYLRRLYQQAKQVSQIITYIWRWADEDPDLQETKTAKALHSFFANPTDETGKNAARLKKLWVADPRDPLSSPEANLLYAVFFQSGSPPTDEYIFPIFDEFELSEEESDLGYLFEIKNNQFNGVLEDVDRNMPQLFNFVIPYPPRPEISEVTVTFDQLNDWINNRNPNEYFADNPYIPTTCS